MTAATERSTSRWYAVMGGASLFCLLGAVALLGFSASIDAEPSSRLLVAGFAMLLLARGLTMGVLVTSEVVTVVNLVAMHRVPRASIVGLDVAPLFSQSRNTSARLRLGNGEHIRCGGLTGGSFSRRSAHNHPAASYWRYSSTVLALSRHLRVPLEH